MNRIHQPLVVRIKKTPSIISLKKNIDGYRYNYNNYNNDNNEVDNFISSDTNLLENLEEFKAKMEQDIIELKHKIENINGVQSDNKDVEHVLQLVNTLNSHLEDYKKITNERIEKLVKLFLIINAKVASIKID